MGFIVGSQQKQARQRAEDSINNTARRSNAAWFCCESTICSALRQNGLDLDNASILLSGCLKALSIKYPSNRRFYIINAQYSLFFKQIVQNTT